MFRYGHSRPDSPSDSKPRIAIKIPTIADSIGGPAREFLRRRLSALLAELEASLQGTRQFNVLTRQKEKLEALLDEQDFSKSGVSLGNAAESGFLEAADYLVMPSIDEFRFNRSAQAVPNISDKYVRTDSGRLEIRADVIDTKSGQKKTSFYLKSSFATGEQVVNSASGIPDNSHFTDMSKKVAAQMADQLVNAVFPMLVLKVEANQVWINRGQDGGLKPGDVLFVYQPGEVLIDPYSKESLGSAETFAGKIEVMRVNPKFTIAKVVQPANAASIATGYIVRKP